MVNDNTPNNVATLLQLSATSPYLATKNLYTNGLQLRGAVAHLGERFNGIEEVESSILSSSTIYLGLAAIYSESVIDQLIYLRIPQTQV